MTNIIDDKYECDIDLSNSENLKKLIESDRKWCSSHFNWQSDKEYRLYFGKKAEAYAKVVCDKFVKAVYKDAPLELVSTKDYFTDSNFGGFSFYNDILDHYFGDYQLIYNYKSKRLVIASFDIKRSTKYFDLSHKGKIYDNNGTTYHFRNIPNAFYVRTNFDMSEFESIRASEIKDCKIKTDNYNKNHFWDDQYLSSLDSATIWPLNLVDVIWEFCENHKDLEGLPQEKPEVVFTPKEFKPAPPKTFSLDNKELLKSKIKGKYPTIPESVLEKAEKSLGLGFDTEFTLVPKVDDKPLPTKKIKFTEIIPNWRDFLYKDDNHKTKYIMSCDYSKIMK